jgi:hypothetical protein
MIKSPNLQRKKRKKRRKKERCQKVEKKIRTEERFFGGIKVSGGGRVEVVRGRVRRRILITILVCTL